MKTEFTLEEAKDLIDYAYYTDVDGVLFDKNVKTLIAFPENKKADKYELPTTIEKLFFRLRSKKLIQEFLVTTTKNIKTSI